MLGRQVTSLLGRPLQARLTRPTPSLQQHLFDLCIRALFSTSISRAATPGRPKKAVGEPSRPVKRAVKRTAQKPADPSTDAAAKKVAIKEKSAKTAAAAKTKKEPKPKKALTEEQIARQKLRKEKATLKELKEVALKPPKLSTFSAWNCFYSESVSKLGGNLKGLSPADVRTQLGANTREISRQWNGITPAELEHYNHLSHTRRSASLASYKSWVQSHTPDQIALANRARTRLNKLLRKPNKRLRYPLIQDERAPKKAAASFVLFTVSRHASGDFKHINVAEASKLLSQEWKGMGEEEKKKYASLYENDQKRYSDEYSDVYGHAPAALLDQQQSQEAAAAAA